MNNLNSGDKLCVLVYFTCTLYKRSACRAVHQEPVLQDDLQRPSTASLDQTYARKVTEIFVLFMVAKCMEFIQCTICVFCLLQTFVYGSQLKCRLIGIEWLYLLCLVSTNQAVVKWLRSTISRQGYNLSCTSL